jgi:hypothetical protein
VKEWKEIYQGNVSPTHPNGKSTSIKLVKRDKDSHFILMKWITRQGAITIFFLYDSNASAPNFVKHYTKVFTFNIDLNPVVVGDFNYGKASGLPKPLEKDQSHCSFCSTSLREIATGQKDSCWTLLISLCKGLGNPGLESMAFHSWACSLAMWQPVLVQRSRETWKLPHTPSCLSALLKYSLQKINCTIAAQHNPEFMSLFAARAPKARVGTPVAAGFQQVVPWLGPAPNVLAV